MKHKFFIIFILIPLPMHPATIVYNLRIAQATKHRVKELEHAETTIESAQEIPKPHPYLGALLGFDQRRHRKDGVEQNIGGCLGTILRTFGTGYARMDFAAGNLKEKADHTCTDHTQTDDILFYLGFSRILTPRTSITFSGLLGVPTHKDEVLQRFQLGTGHVGLGLQIDGYFNYSPEHPHHAFLAAARLVHFFPRTACTLPLPIFNNKPKPFRVDLGNIADLLIGHYSHWRNNAFEFGYNPAFAFGASLCPNIPLIPTANAIRNSFYANYRRIFFIRSHASGIGIGATYSFDNLPVLGFSRIGTVWIAWGINF